MIKLTKEFLIEQYLNQNKIIMDIAKETHYSFEWIRKCLIKFNISIRKSGRGIKGKEHYSWKGGKSPCTRCGKLTINYNSKICRYCWKLEKFENKKHYFCCDCGKEICRRSERCKSCANRISTINYWKNDEYRKKVLINSRKSYIKGPNKAEQKLFNILNIIFPNKYKLNIKGNISLIGNKVPDFIDIYNNRIIEMFGDYWHSKDWIAKHGCYEDTEVGRIKYFSKYGYSTLIVWEHELKNIPKLQEKIKQFSIT